MDGEENQVENQQQEAAPEQPPAEADQNQEVAAENVEGGMDGEQPGSAGAEDMDGEAPGDMDGEEEVKGEDEAQALAVPDDGQSEGTKSAQQDFINDPSKYPLQSDQGGSPSLEI